LLFDQVGTFLPDTNPNFIRPGEICAHIMNTFETTSIYQKSTKIFSAHCKRIAPQPQPQRNPLPSLCANTGTTSAG